MESKNEAMKRLQREGRWQEADGLKEDHRRRLRLEGKTKRESSEEAWRLMIEAFPPLPVEEPEEPAVARAFPPLANEGMSGTDSQSGSAHGGRVTGLSDIPAAWPSLSANASLAAEIQWVQASRLDVVEELPGGGTRVHLDRADSPAPSKAAIGWLETSIRAYSKYCDIAARATAQQEDEQAHVRRERMAIDEVRALLSETLEAQDS